MEAACEVNVEQRMEKKLIRKHKKKQILLKNEGIEITSQPTQNLVIANGGLGNGVSRKELLGVLKEAGNVKALLMPPDKPYAFVTYETVEEAMVAYNTLNGCNLESEELKQNIFLYLSYVEKVHYKEDTCQTLPPGLIVVEDFVSPNCEEKLLSSIDWDFGTDNESAQKSLKHRKVKHYGYEFRYDNNNIDKDKPLPGGLPEVCSEVLNKCLEYGYIRLKPDQLTINQYEPGQGIPPHIDTHSAFEDGIISLSLGSQTVMDFKHPDGRCVAVMLPRRSLLVMTGESRFLWSHGITPRKLDVVQATENQMSRAVINDIRDLTLNKRETRTSFTFRKVRRTACNCGYPAVCDNHIKKDVPLVPHCESEAFMLEQEYVHKVYEEIAGHFSSTRHTPWPKIATFLKSLPQGAIVADIGCGNGKYLAVNPTLYMVGCDRSKNLVDICGERGFQAFVCDAMSVPIRSNVCDACISIAVIHHFSTEERRLAAITELKRLLCPGGKALIYVWAVEQEYKKERSKYLKEDKRLKEESNNQLSKEASTNSCTCIDSQISDSLDKISNWENRDRDIIVHTQPKLSVHTNRTAFTSQELLVPWHLKGDAKKSSDAHKEKELADMQNLTDTELVFHRYYHVFCEGELEAACRRVAGVRIEQSYYDQGNWCVILEKQ
ncbi:alkylated DNA repair protein alkB homolog 8 [Protopterus annectens]|uniref:alkylated DNA repair protein alkB homolog 8 n=1 Tax=Protopterus annectens TaxID=7888 RepID=UPI001CFB10FC|nr:alkylated DNA repair protein alkB homolog 8 [Protopterus annectens]